MSYKKAAGRPRLTYDEAVEETLCFGWIDSLPRKLDAERTTLLFTPRKPKSGWSKVNKERLARLEAGLMPADLTAALATDETAARHFAAFSLSSRKMILTWVLAAKRPGTRAARVAETRRLAALNRRANVDRE